METEDLEEVTEEVMEGGDDEAVNGVKAVDFGEEAPAAEEVEETQTSAQLAGQDDTAQDSLEVDQMDSQNLDAEPIPTARPKRITLRIPGRPKPKTEPVSTGPTSSAPSRATRSTRTRQTSQPKTKTSKRRGRDASPAESLAESSDDSGTRSTRKRTRVQPQSQSQSQPQPTRTLRSRASKTSEQVQSEKEARERVKAALASDDEVDEEMGEL